MPRGNKSGMPLSPESAVVPIKLEKETKLVVFDHDDAGKKKSSNPKTTTNRKRRTHRKSRLGCTNCKLRSVKCDETKPACGRCLSSGFTCTYSNSAPALQLSYSGVFKLDMTAPTPAPYLSKQIPVMLPMAGKVGTYEMRPYEIAAIDRYLNRTAVAFKTDDKKYQSAISVDMANSQPQLYHIFTAFALLHDVYLADSPPTVWRTSHAPMSFHLYHATALFKQKLQQYTSTPALPIGGKERDTLWMSSTLLTIATFANVDSFDPFECWPLRPADIMDLGWIKMDRGKSIVWEILDPSRPESHYNTLYRYMAESNMPNNRASIRPHALPARFYTVYNLNEYSNADNNPYYSQASVLSQILYEEATFRSGIRFFAFPSQMSRGFLRLLEAKDARALLMLAYWFSRLVEFNWWFMRPRAIMEGTAICIYLQNHHSDDEDIMTLLQVPQNALFNAYRETKWGDTTYLEQLEYRWPEDLRSSVSTASTASCASPEIIQLQLRTPESQASM